LKSSGSLILHCDPTMSHYLKVLLDAIFGPELNRNEIIWKRATSVKGNFGQGQKALGSNTDTLLYYARARTAKFHQVFTDYTEEYLQKMYRYVEPDGRRYRLISMIGPGGAAKGNPEYEVMGVKRFWRYSRERMQELIDAGMVIQTKAGNVPQRKLYLDEGKGVAIQSLWTDIPNLQASTAENLGYPTQKPLALLERIIEITTDEGDVVLDPFCGCGTAVDAAHKMKRQWLGIDITYIAVDLIEKRLQHTYGKEIAGRYEVLGIPRDHAAALALFSRSPFDFERWAVSLVGGQPNQKQVGDKGIDGVARSPLNARGSVGQVLISVKGGTQLNPAMVRDLGGTVTTQKAEMGVLITNKQPARGMIDEANHAGSYQHPHYGKPFPRIQMITVDELLSGKRPQTPPTMLPYIQALRAKTPADQGSLFDPDSN